jgi:hypothetical protein
VRRTSDATKSYNCIAWAFGDDSRWWWPGDPELAYWPVTGAGSPTLEVFREALEQRGFRESNAAEADSAEGSIALYGETTYGVTEITHAAKRLGNSEWSSKLGEDVDVAHTLSALENGLYGQVVAYFVK